jgi:perosamine synthetase
LNKSKYYQLRKDVVNLKENHEWKIPLYKIYTDQEDLNLVTKIISRGNKWAIGPEIEEFEEKLKNYVGVDYCLTLNSGTSALHASLIANSIGTGNEVIIPSFTFISTANSVINSGAKPVFSDIEEETLGLDPSYISERINSKTKAIIPVDYAGQSCKIFEIIDIAKQNKIKVIEDAAESLGSKIKGRSVGSISDSAIFSFCGNKVITTGEGGAVVTNDKAVFEKIKLVRSHGRQDSINYFENSEQAKYIETGYNWRMSSITAALGIAQLSKLDKIINKRIDNANSIITKLTKIPEIITPKAITNSLHVFQMFTVRLPDKKIRDRLHEFLKIKKIFSKVYFEPIHKMSFYLKKEVELPQTEKISEQVLTLPLYPNMTKEEINYLTCSISEFFEEKK